MARPAKSTELTMKKPVPGRAIKRGNEIRLALKPKNSGWKGITLNFATEVFTCRSLNKSQLESFFQFGRGYDITELGL